MIPKLLLITAMIGGLACASPEKHSAPPFEPDIAKKLIARILDVRAENVEVGSITYGALQTASGFQHRDACRVTAIVQVRENAVVMRRVRHYDFLWNCGYGWFHQRVATERGGEALDIWSELSGDFTVK